VQQKHRALPHIHHGCLAFLSSVGGLSEPWKQIITGLNYKEICLTDFPDPWTWYRLGNTFAFKSPVAGIHFTKISESVPKTYSFCIASLVSNSGYLSQYSDWDGRPRNRGSICDEGKGFFASLRSLDRLWRPTPPPLFSGYRESFPGLKAAVAWSRPHKFIL
jgi:hypothetical protein